MCRQQYCRKLKCICVTGMAVQVGCLMLATDRVLTPWVRNTEASDSCSKLRGVLQSYANCYS